MDASRRQRVVAPGAVVGRHSCAGPISSTLGREQLRRRRAVSPKLSARATTSSPAAAYRYVEDARPAATSRCRSTRRPSTPSSPTCSSRTRSRCTGACTLTLGSKLEHDTLSGWGLQPTARAHVGAGAASPSLDGGVAGAADAVADRSARSASTSSCIPGPGLPIVVGIVGNPDYQAEALARRRSRVPARARRRCVGRRDGVPRPLQRAADARAARAGLRAVAGPPHLFVATRLENRLQRRHHRRRDRRAARAGAGLAAGRVVFDASA